MNNAEKLKKILSINLKRYLDSRGLTQKDMSQDLGIPEMTVSNWLNAKTYPRPDKVQLMADYFRINRSDLTEERPTNLIDIQPKLIKIPVLGQIACGEPILAEENMEGYIYEIADGLPSGELTALVAKGDSMEPTIPNGSKVVIRGQADVENGEIAAVLVNGDTEATLKRVKKQGNIVMLMPDNPQHEPIIASKDYPVRIIGKAVRVTRDLF